MSLGDPLDGIPAPAGNPDAAAAAARAHAQAAEQLRTASVQLVRCIGHIVGGAWIGVAADACARSTAQIAAVYAAASDTSQQTSAALSAYASALRAAQEEYRRARQLADTALAEEAQHRADAAARLQHATVVGDLVGMFAWQAAADGSDGWTSPARFQAASLATQAGHDAQVAAGAPRRRSMPRPPRSRRLRHPNRSRITRRSGAASGTRCPGSAPGCTTASPTRCRWRSVS